MHGLPHVKIAGEPASPTVEIDGQDATKGLHALAVTMSAGQLPSMMMEYFAVPEFEGLSKCVVNVVNPLRAALDRIDLQRLRSAVDMAGMGEHPADVVLDELVRMVDDLE